MAFRDENTIREIEEGIYKPYELECYERQSINSIKKSIKNYCKERRMINDYVEYLEHLLFKLENVRNEEQIRGHLTKELDSDIFEIKKLISQINLIIKQNN